MTIRRRSIALARKRSCVAFLCASRMRRLQFSSVDSFSTKIQLALSTRLWTSKRASSSSCLQLTFCNLFSVTSTTNATYRNLIAAVASTAELPTIMLVQKGRFLIGQLIFYAEDVQSAALISTVVTSAQKYSQRIPQDTVCNTQKVFRIETYFFCPVYRLVNLFFARSLASYAQWTSRCSDSYARRCQLRFSSRFFSSQR